MTAVIVPFPKGEYVAVEVFGGLVTGGNCAADIGKHRYFVTVVAADGARMTMADADTFGGALRQAEQTRFDFGVRAPVKISGGAA